MLRKLHHALLLEGNAHGADGLALRRPAPQGLAVSLRGVRRGAAGDAQHGPTARRRRQAAPRRLVERRFRDVKGAHAAAEGGGIPPFGP